MFLGLTCPLSSELQRRDSLEAEAFLEAVRFYRQERGRYGAGDLLLGLEPEVGKAFRDQSFSSEVVACCSEVVSAACFGF